ncbi:MAG: ADP-glyceromanno-heptose 6-epimerase [Desulfovibrio sp.]|jgi:ADP-L-glycero-D-manno-heptose 6-epimerase|nr:ADP-glyceromanno-heptose 6-epimerase [Desulfovibrio sp.]
MYIVTGGAGFIGSALLWKLNSQGVDDILVVDNLACSEKWKNLVKRRFRDYIHRDVFREHVESGRPASVLGARPEALVHLGACSGTTERDADFLMRNNTAYSKLLCRYALDRGIRFIQAGSAASYGDGSAGFDDDPQKLDDLRPLNMYGYSKHLFDLWARREGALRDIAVLKFFNVYGPNEQHKGDMRSMVNKAFHQVKESGRVRLFRPASSDGPENVRKRDFVYVKDCVEILYRLLLRTDVNGIFNVGTGRARTWNELIGAVFKAMRRPENIEYVDMPPELRGKYQDFTEADIGRLRAAGLPVPSDDLESCVRDYIRNYLESPDPYL